MTLDERKARIKQVSDQIAQLYREDGMLRLECPHRILKTKWESMYCDVCGKGFGWCCPRSPDQLCHYDESPDNYDNENCVYCGLPEERK